MAHSSEFFHIVLHIGNTSHSHTMPYLPLAYSSMPISHTQYDSIHSCTVFGLARPGHFYYLNGLLRMLLDLPACTAQNTLHRIAALTTGCTFLFMTLILVATSEAPLDDIYPPGRGSLVYAISWSSAVSALAIFITENRREQLRSFMLKRRAKASHVPAQ